MPLGHRLRDAVLEAASGPERRVKVAIVGAGPSGLAAAWRLERLGERDYRVFDLEPRAGGTSCFGTDGVVPHPWGAHYVPAPTNDDPRLVELLGEIDALAEREPTPRAREQLLVREPEERIFAHGEWHEGLLPEVLLDEAGRTQLTRFEAEVARWARFRDVRGRRAFTLPMRLGSDDAEVLALDRLSAARWCDDRGLVHPVVRWWLEYACRDDYGLSLADTSAWALLFYFCSRRRGEGPETEPFLAWPEGNGRLVRHLTGVVADRLSLGRLVTDVRQDEGSVRFGVFDAAQGTLAAWRAEALILAVPKFVAARIYRPWREAPPAALAELRYGSWLVCNLHFRRAPRSEGVPLAWDNVLYDSPSLGYVSATHQTFRERGPTIWTWYLPLVDVDARRAREGLAALDHRQAADAAVGDLRRAHPDLDASLTRLDAWRWGHAMIQPRVGLVSGARRVIEALELDRVVLAHSDLSGIALFEEALDRGCVAAERVLGRLRG